MRLNSVCQASTETNRFIVKSETFREADISISLLNSGSTNSSSPPRT